MGIKITVKSKSPIVKEATKIASLIATFKFEREGMLSTKELDKLSDATRALNDIINRYKWNNIHQENL